MTDDTDADQAQREILVQAARQESDAIARAHPRAVTSVNGDASDEDVDVDTAPNAVVEHLVFHQALADHDPDRLAEYLSMARSDVASFRDPFDRAIALTFHLVLDQQMDPWSIDLSKFSTLYADRIRDTPEVDLITGGRLLAMAWTVLLRQTQGLLDRAEPQEDPEPDPMDWDMAWDEFPEAWGEPADEATQYTERVLDDEREPPISESVFHQGDRRVTLFELVEALEEGRREAERRERLARERKKARQEAADEDDEDVREKVHKEDLEAEIHGVRTRLQAYEAETDLAEVHDGTRADFLTVFVSCLFLSRAEMVDVRQDEFPTGPIHVTPRERLHDPDATLVGLPDDETNPEEADGEDAEADAAETDEDATGTEENDDEPEQGPPEERAVAAKP